MEKKTQEEQGSAVRGAAGPDEAREAGRGRSPGMSPRAAGGGRCQSKDEESSAGTWRDHSFQVRLQRTGE